MKLSIRWGVILGCVLLVWGTQLIIMPVSFFSSRQVMLEHTRDIMGNILDLTLEETRNYFAMARGAAHLTERLIFSEIVNTDTSSIEKLEFYFCDQLDLYPQFAGIYFATPAGDFYYVNREPDPGKGVYRFKLIEYDEKGSRSTRFFWRDKKRQITAEKIDFQDTYDPRQRPWYKKAVKEKSIIWTDPYVFFSSKKPGITTAGPLVDKRGVIKGVVGVDIELDVLSGFVGKLRVGKTGMAFIVNQHTDVIAFPDVSSLLYKGAGDNQKIRLPKLKELETPLCSLAYEAVSPELKEKGMSSLDTPAFASFEHENKTYYTMFTRVQGDKIAWMIGVYIPEEDYLGAIMANRRMTLFLTFAASVLATICGLAFARRIIDPVSALDRAARKIESHDYSAMTRIQSAFREIQRTADSFFDMKLAVKNYRTELKRKEAIHRAITDTANEAIFMVDDQGMVSYWNTAAHELFGYAAQEAIGCRIVKLRPFQPRFHTGDLSLYTLFGEKAHPRSLKSIELSITTRKEQTVPVELSMVGISIEDKSYTIAVIRDISSRKKGENEKLAIWQQLQQARKMEAIGTLAGGIAHDFNNILSGILGYAELLQAEAREEQTEHIEGIISAGERARELVRQILSFSFQENQKLTPLAMPGIVDEACKLMASSLPKSIRIKKEVDPHSPMICGDATQIHQVALNLMTNAFQAMERTGGTLSVSLAPIELTSGDLLEDMELTPGVYLCYSVTDTGVGISAQAMDKIFDPYFTTKPDRGGTGLGLAVIKGIVQNHSGGIHVESTPGQGSRFQVFLPAAEEGKAVKPLPGPSRIQKGSEHILLVDDQKTVINVERQILEILGYRVTSRLSGQEALNTFTADPKGYDLVVTDMSMPEMTGEELALKIMEIEPDTPVILLTGYSESMGRDKAKAMGIRDLLMKPVRLREFSAAIRKELDKKA